MVSRTGALSLALLVAACASGDDVETSRGQGTPFADFQGTRVHYEDRGSGKRVLVLVHGWASDGTVWTRQVPALEKTMRLLVVDLPGHGKSDAPPAAYSMDLFAGAVRAVLDDAGVKKAVLVGHSNGTPVIRQCYRRFPDRVQGLVVVDGALRQTAPEEGAREMLAELKREDFESHREEILSPMLDLVPESLRSEVGAMMARTPQHAIAGGLEAALDPSIWKDDPIQVPVLCLMARSPFWSEDYEAYVRELAPEVDYRVFPGVSHFLHMEAPEGFNRVVAEFVAALP